jgi:REP element-mobilizing transposase RayT
MMEKPHFYHYATEGLKDDVLFGSVAEFIAGMNRIAICLCRLGPAHPVQVICFVLMDNHVHFILYGLEEDCDLFMRTYKNATERWLTHHPETNHPGKSWRIGHWLIGDKDRLRTTIAYIHRNPTAAGMAVSPAGYRWSSASLLFSDFDWIRGYGEPVSSLSGKARIRLLCSKTELPDNWILLPDGLIWPGEYVNYKLMEKQFDSVQDYNYCLNKRIEEEMNLEMRKALVSLPDGEILSRARAMAERLYQESRITGLTVSQRLSLAILLRKETGTTAKQIARIVRLPLSDIEPILNPKKA